MFRRVRKKRKQRPFWKYVSTWHDEVLGGLVGADDFVQKLISLQVTHLMYS